LDKVPFALRMIWRFVTWLVERHSIPRGNNRNWMNQIRDFKAIIYQHQDENREALWQKSEQASGPRRPHLAAGFLGSMGRTPRTRPRTPSRPGEKKLIGRTSASSLRRPKWLYGGHLLLLLSHKGWARTCPNIRMKMGRLHGQNLSRLADPEDLIWQRTFLAQWGRTRRTQPRTPSRPGEKKLKRRVPRAYADLNVYRESTSSFYLSLLFLLLPHTRFI
jgi:hypothetical protein